MKEGEDELEMFFFNKNYISLVIKSLYKKKRQRLFKNISKLWTKRWKSLKLQASEKNVWR